MRKLYEEQLLDNQMFHTWEQFIAKNSKIRCFLYLAHRKLASKMSQTLNYPAPPMTNSTNDQKLVMGYNHIRRGRAAIGTASATTITQRCLLTREGHNSGCLVLKVGPVWNRSVVHLNEPAFTETNT